PGGGMSRALGGSSRKNSSLAGCPPPPSCYRPRQSATDRNQREKYMRSVHALGVAALVTLTLPGPTFAGEPKSGGILRMYHRASPRGPSIHEGATYSINIPFMPVFNNLVIFDQHIAQNSVDTLRPELAESWAWSGYGKTLTFKLRKDVKWHDGKPFTSADVKCTFDMLMGKSQQKFR